MSVFMEWVLLVWCCLGIILTIMVIIWCWRELRGDFK